MTETATSDSPGPSAAGPSPAGPLPSGRRGAAALTPEQVAAHQRERMLTAMTSAVAELGYAAATVADVIARAKVSRATFYQQFTDKQDCFLSAYDEVSRSLLPAEAPGGELSVASLIAGYLNTLADHPDEARVFIVEITGLGLEGHRRRAESMGRFTWAIALLVGATEPADQFACEAFVAAVAMLVSVRVAAGDLDGVRALAEPLAELAGRLLPFAGPTGS